MEKIEKMYATLLAENIYMYLPYVDFSLERKRDNKIWISNEEIEKHEILIKYYYKVEKNEEAYKKLRLFETEMNIKYLPETYVSVTFFYKKCN